MRPLLNPSILLPIFFLFLCSQGHIQISQVPNRSEPNNNGEINYEFIFQLLQKLGYDQWIGCEYTRTLFGKLLFYLTK